MPCYLMVDAITLALKITYRYETEDRLGVKIKPLAIIRIAKNINQTC